VRGGTLTKGCPITKTGYLPRYRFPIAIIWFAVFLYIYLKSKTTIILLFFLFRVKVTHKTVCEWTKKFYKPVNLYTKKHSKKKNMIEEAKMKFLLYERMLSFVGA
jgi:transposase-like protein